MNRNATGRPQGGVERQSEGCSPWWPVREGTQEHGRWRLGARGLLSGWVPPISDPSWTLTGGVWPSCVLQVPCNLGVGTVMIKRLRFREPT